MDITQSIETGAILTAFLAVWAVCGWAAMFVLETWTESLNK